MSEDQRELKKCPFCAEEIRIEAVKCKHCGEMLTNKNGVASTGVPNIIFQTDFFFIFLLALGLFLPFLHVPIIGTVNKISDPFGIGIIFLILSLFLFIYTYLKLNFERIILSLSMAIYFFSDVFIIWKKMSEMGSEMAEKANGNPFAALGGLIASTTVGFGIGAYLIGVSLIALVFISILEYRKKTSLKPILSFSSRAILMVFIFFFSASVFFGMMYMKMPPEKPAPPKSAEEIALEKEKADMEAWKAASTGKKHLFMGNKPKVCLFSKKEGNSKILDLVPSSRIMQEIFSVDDWIYVTEGGQGGWVRREDVNQAD